VDAAAEAAAHSALVASASETAAASDTHLDPSSEGGSGAPSCSAVTYKPRGYFDHPTKTAHIEVTADAWCNFTAPEIVIKVILQGREGNRSISHPSSDVTCRNSSSCSATAYYSRYLYCGEFFEFEHYGVPYGSFRLKNGSWRTLQGAGVQGPATEGTAYHYWCE
jgi:hypothetical protein